MTYRLYLSLMGLLFFCHGLLSQGIADPIPTSIREKEAPVYVTQRINGEAPSIDGRLDDAAWEQVPWSTEYHQWQPESIDSITQRTLFKILYDNRYLYMAWRCYDTEPGKIEARLGRRDDFPGDWVEVNFDSFNDKRTGFSFTTSASGVKNDEFISKDGNDWESSWNPTWLTKAQTDSLGYTVECRIPFSQLRFGKANEQIWGLQSTRRLFRYQEMDTWAPIDQAEQGWVSRFGTLRGIKGVKPRKPLEFQPYVLGQARTGGDYNPDNPFDERTDTRLSVGLDGRLGITNDIAVDYTINPDFGQVEADPGAINLDGFQIFFREQRPFFVENQNIFTYELTEAEAGGSFNSDLLFYSRRIGRNPSRFVSNDESINFYADQPANTTILGAAKVSGKTQSGLSLGLLSSVTEREFAVIDDGGERRKTEIEPLTFYSVGRMQQDFNDRNSNIGLMLTSVNRNLQTSELDFLHRNAYTGGIDFLHRWDNRAWYISANAVFSRVEGSTDAILETQTAFEHLFQRPGASHIEVDSSRTSLTGTGGTVRIGELEGKWVFDAGITWRSPELELNDIGFLLNTDEFNVFAWGARRWQEPFGIFRRLQWNQNIYLRWDWSGEPLYRAYNTNAWGQFKNFWNINGGVTVEQLDVSKNILRGGPLLRRPRGAAYWFGFGSDGRKRVQVNVNYNNGGSYDGVVRSTSYSLWTRYQPSNALNLSLAPRLSRTRRDEQYFTQEEFGDDIAYLNGRIDQTTLSVTLRATYNLTPNFTIQYYGQPFIAKGTYTNFNRVSDDPMALDFDDRFVVFAEDQISFDSEGGIYRVDEDRDGNTDYSFGDPDFSFIQFRSNMVARWEYRPNSELFLVWSQGITTSGDPNQDVFNSLADDLFGGDIRNTFLVKMTYRWVR